MGIWNEIKKALNSTLGTSEFKPLNEIMTDLVFSERIFVPSDRLYYTLFDGDIAGLEKPDGSPLENKVDLFVSQIEGSFDMGLKLGHYTRATLYKNGVNIWSGYVSGSTGETKTISGIAVNKGDAFSLGVEGYNSSNYGHIYHAKIYAEILDGANIKILYKGE